MRHALGIKKSRETETERKEEKESRGKEKVLGKVVKYVGETARSCYERQKEHFRDYNNLNIRSHLLKHYMDVHQDIELKDMEVRVRIIGRYKSSFERQIGESIWLNSYLRDGVSVLNSKNEYNRCTIPRLGLDLIQMDEIDEYREKQEEKKRKQILSNLREKLRYGKELRKAKRQRLNVSRDTENKRELKSTDCEKKEITQITETQKYLIEEKIKRKIKKKRMKGEIKLEDKTKLEKK